MQSKASNYAKTLLWGRIGILQFILGWYGNPEFNHFWLTLKIRKTL